MRISFQSLFSIYVNAEMRLGIPTGLPRRGY